jgi:hypothetical protein
MACAAPKPSGRSRFAQATSGGYRAVARHLSPRLVRDHLRHPFAGLGRCRRPADTRAVAQPAATLFLPCRVGCRPAVVASLGLRLPGPSCWAQLTQSSGVSEFARCSTVDFGARHVPQPDGSADDWFRYWVRETDPAQPIAMPRRLPVARSASHAAGAAAGRSL